MTVGLSLSFCIRDIANGVIDEEEVDYIVTACYVDSTHPFIDVVRTYREGYWLDNPECVRIAFRMYKRGQLLFPRVEERPVINISSGHWCDHAYWEEWYGWNIQGQRYTP